MLPACLLCKRCVLREPSFFTTLVFVVAKDVSIFVFYFLLLKYNLTNETYTREMISDFPAAPTMTIVEMLGASLYITFLPLLIDLYLVSRIQKVITTDSISGILGRVLCGMLFHLPIVLIWMLLNSQGGVVFNTASKIGLLSSIPFAGLFWLALGLQPVFNSEQ